LVTSFGGGDCCDLLEGGVAGPRARQLLRKGVFNEMSLRASWRSARRNECSC